VVNTFVIFLSRIIGYIVDRVILKNDRGQGIGFFVTVMVSQIVLGLFASIIVAWFSRQREFRADAASAQLLGSPQPMVNALARLGGLQPGALPQAMQASGISAGPGGWGALFSTHPPIEQRIEALRSRAPGQT
jgi:heat shock protein HtpX